jgi:murein L,D-transpeptidase YafK
VRSLILACLLLLLPLPPIGSAPAWEALIADSPGLPPALVAVDKDAHQIYYLEKRSPPAVRDVFPSIHGQGEGDKQSEGDLRTPEGVYFITGRIRRPLDFVEYGSQAHGLNYPNPVDRLRGKTGSGIWIHSKGLPIADQATRGCIAVDLAAIDILSPRLLPGTPVVVAATVLSDGIAPIPDSSSSPLDAVTRLISEKTAEWNRAWAARSPAMFDFYDPEAYGKAQGESFPSFRSQKEYLFQRFPWLHIQHGEINVLQGPGYWVSWFKQYYRAPNMRTEGIRRLYWQPVKNGELKIVGMEWLPQDLGMERAYLDGLTPGVAAFVEKWRLAWEQGNLEEYLSFYADAAVQDNRRGLAAIREHKERTWAARKPLSVQLHGLRVRLDEQGGVRADMNQIYRDTVGYQDRGIKELLLYPEGDAWRIAAETWKRL